MRTPATGVQELQARSDANAAVEADQTEDRSNFT